MVKTSLDPLPLGQNPLLGDIGDRWRDEHRLIEPEDQKNCRMALPSSPDPSVLPAMNAIWLLPIGLVCMAFAVLLAWIGLSGMPEPYL